MTRKSVLLVAFSVFTYIACFSQSKQTTQHVLENWPFVKTLPHVQWEPNKPGCNLIYVQGKALQILSTDAMDVAIAQEGFEDHPDRLAFILILTNKGKLKLDIQPDLFWAVERQPKEKYMAFVSPEEIGRSLQKSARWRGALLGLNGALATETVTTNATTTGTWNRTIGNASSNGNFDQTTTATTRVPDEAARQKALEQARQIHDTANNQSDAADSFAIRRTTLFPGQKIMGVVWFKADKHLKTADLLLPITDEKHSVGVVYVFPQTILAP